MIMNNNNDIFICDFFVNGRINEIVFSAAKVGKKGLSLLFVMVMQVC